MKNRLAILLLSIIPFFGSSQELPSRFQNNLIYLTPKLSDGNTITFFTDTGGGWNAISKELVEKYNWQTSQKASEDGSILITNMPKFSTSASIPLAGLNNWYTGKLGVVPSKELSIGNSVDGFLGGRWHAEKVIDFDYPQQRIAVLSHFANEQDFLQIPLGFQKNENGEYTTAFPRIEITINQKKIPMLFDTGASALPSNEAKQVMNISGKQVATSFIVADIFDKWVESNPDWLVLRNACEFSNADMIRVPKVKIGNVTVGSVWFTRREDSSFHQFMSSMMDKRIDGALGGSALKYTRIIVDYPNEVAFIKASGES